MGESTEKTPRELWVEALRSGEYRQCKDVLHNVDEQALCCFGVACEVYQKHVGGLEITESKCGNKTLLLYSGEMTSPPWEVIKWLGLSSRSGRYEGERDRAALMGDNDRGKTFAQIADIIESNPPGLLEE